MPAVFPRVLGAVAILAAAAVFLGPVAAVGQATAYIPLGDPAYRDLDALVAAGFVRKEIIGSRPYSQTTFARALAEATARLSRAKSGAGAERVAAVADRPKQRILEAAARLETRFAVDSNRGIRGARLDIASTDSPLRRVPNDGIDADIAPLRQRNAGRAVPSGSSVAGEAWGVLGLGAHVAASVQPRIWFAAPRDAGGEAGAELLTGYARAVFGNLAVDVGRNTLARGTSLEMSPTLSTNARGLDMIRVSMERPWTLPWIFRHLGPAKFAGSLATLGDNRDNPGGIQVAWEASVRPHANLELGMTLVGHQGGKGTGPATLGQRIAEALFVAKRALPLTHFLWEDPYIGDKWFGADARLTLPGTGMDAYVEFGTTDDVNLFFMHPERALRDEASWLGGLRWRGLGDEGRLDLSVEATHNGLDAYRHGQLTSGLTLDHRVLGSPLGPLATSFQGAADWTSTWGRVTVIGARERYSSDQYGAFGQAYVIYRRTVDNPDEIRLRATVDWVRESLHAGRMGTSVRAGYEHVTRFNFTEASRSNFLLQAGVRWAW